jgi:hypothetical protein
MEERMTASILALILAIAFSGTAVAQSSLIDLSKPMTGKTRSVTYADGKPVEFGVPLYEDDEPAARDATSPAMSSSGLPTAGGYQAGAAAACGGSHYGATSCDTGRPKTVAVKSYTRKDGTFVRSHYRSAPRGRR